jgi:hypothetical protein
MEKETYYGTLNFNQNILTVVKVIDGGISERRMIQMSFWKSFLKKGDYKNAVQNITHETMSYYRKDQLHPGCDENLFNELYINALKYFNS